MEKKIQDDLKLKLMLVLVRDRRAMQGRIRSVRFMREYGELPEDLGAIKLSGMSRAEHADLAARIGIKPKTANAKSDIYLNDIGYRIEALGQHPTLVAEGLTADGLGEICRKAGVAAEPIHEAFDRYWRRRQGGELEEEVVADAEDSPFHDVMESLLPVVSYLLFTGNEQGADSMFAADGLLDYQNPMDTETWAILDKDEAVQQLRDRLRISAEGDSHQSARYRIWSPGA